jgi:hypothetical protein
MHRRFLRGAGIAVALGLVTAVPAQAYTWRSSSSTAMWATLSGHNAAGAYGTWYVSAGSNLATFYPNVYAANTTEGGAYARADHSLSSNNVSWFAGPSARTADWNSKSWHQLPKSVTLPSSGRYVKTLVTVGLDRRLQSDPTHTTSIPTQGY